MKLLSAVVAIFLWTRLSFAPDPHEPTIEKYELTIAPYFLDYDIESGTFDGEAEIVLSCEKGCPKEITFSSEELEYNETEVYDVATDKLLLTTFYTISRKKQLILLFVEGFGLSKYRVRLTYTGRIGPTLGLQLLQYREPFTGMHYVVWTKMGTTRAQTVFPHFVDLETRYVFHISIICPTDYLSFSNTELSHSDDIRDNFTDGDVVNSYQMITDSSHQHWFEPTPPIPGYMVSMLVIKPRYSLRHDNIHLTRDYLSTLTTNSRDVIDKTHNYYKELFDTNDFPEGHIMGIYQFARGTVIQTPGLGFYDEEILVSDQRSMAVIDEQIMKTKISYGRALAYFADKMNPFVWEHDWVTNGLAIYYEYFGTHNLYPELGLDIQFVTDEMHRAMHAGDIFNYFPLRFVQAFEALYVESVQNSLRNAKAASFIRMLTHAITIPRFNATMKDFVNETLWKTYLSMDFFHSINWPQNSFLDKGTFYNDWFNCYDNPLVTVTLSKDKKSAHMDQKRTITPYKQNDLFTIPITYTTNIARDFNNTFPSLYMNYTRSTTNSTNSTDAMNSLNTTSHTVVNFARPIEWIIVNIQQVGLYRVLYTEQIYRAIGKELKELGKNKFTEIHQLNRAQLIDDLFSFYIRRFVSSETVIEFLKYLRNEYDFAPWKAALRGFSYLSSILDAEDLPGLGKFVLFLSENVYDKLYVLPKDSDTVLDGHLRNIILNANCRYGNTKLTQVAVDKINDYLQEGRHIPDDIMTTMICCAVRKKDHAMYRSLYFMYKRENYLKVKRRMLDGLACAESPLDVEKYLALMKTGDIPVEEIEDHLYKLLRESPDTAWFVFQLILRDMVGFSKLLENKSRMGKMMHTIGILLTEKDEVDYWNFFTTDYSELFDYNDYYLGSADNVHVLHQHWKSNEYPKLKKAISLISLHSASGTIRDSAYLQLFMLIFLFFPTF